MSKNILKFIMLSMAIAAFTAFVVSPAFSHEETAVSVKEIKSAVNETHHFEVKPESLEGYRIPYMKVTVMIIDQATQEKQSIELHPMFGGNFHYAANVALKPQQYFLQFHLDPPTFARGHAREIQWLMPVEAEFPFDASAKFEKSIKIGSKETPDMKISFEAERAESMFILAGTEEEHATQGHQILREEEEQATLGHQLEELLPFEHVGEGHWFALVLSILLWASLIYTAYSLVQKFSKGRTL